MKAFKKTNDNLFFLEVNVFNFKYRVPLLCNYFYQKLSDAFGPRLFEVLLEMNGGLSNSI